MSIPERHRADPIKQTWRKARRWLPWLIPASSMGCAASGGAEAQWWKEVDAFEASSGQRGYRQFIEWLRGKCYSTKEDAMRAFYEEGHPLLAREFGDPT